MKPEAVSDSPSYIRPPHRARRSLADFLVQTFWFRLPVVWWRYVSIELLLSMEQTLADNVREMGLQNSWPRSGKGKSSGAEIEPRVLGGKSSG